MIWRWLKAGHMEEGKFHNTESGTPQGGVISPILANIYLNELDWELDKENIRFVRYADDFLLFAKTEEEIKRAGAAANRVITDLGLEVSMEKTKFVNFNNENFNFLGFTFEHWRQRKNDGESYFIVRPTENSIKDFKTKIKEKTRKSLTLSTKAWLDALNPIIRGKINYYLNIYKAVKANEGYGQKSRCILQAFSKELHAVDSYVRQRLRVAMIHKNPCQRKGWLMTSKWNNEYFVKIGLIPSHWLYYNKMWGYTLEMYLEKITAKSRAKLEKQIKKLKEKGQEYYTPDRVSKINAAKSYA
nr:reverse transcriptase domain-containing protein [Alkaliphilus serpentinus]